ncbi:MAG: T9SS type A sorting domain-containing protein [Bacteroidota bacterium]|nr:T9SS type A sorting domain-containing protein [Bacteroidota bacterium]
MKPFTCSAFFYLVISILCLPLFISCNQNHIKGSEEENEGKENLALSLKEEFLQEFNRTKDPSTNTVPKERLLVAGQEVKQFFLNKTNAISGISWQEQGPANVGGRTRAILFDKNDATNNTIFAGGVSGGIWKCSNLSNASPNWIKVTDILDNIAVSCIVQDQANPSVMYFGTGEIWGNTDALRGLGIWKSTDGGTTWNHLGATTNPQFNFVQNIIVAPYGVFAATGSGLLKSSDGGNTWTTVLVGAMSDVQLAANGDIYTSNFLGNLFKSTNSQQGSSGTWANISVPGSHQRLKLATAPSNINRVYALCQQASGDDVDAIYRTDDGGTSWVTCTVPKIIDQGNNSVFTRGQAWYDLAAAVDPNNANVVIIGGVDGLRSTNGGLSWNQITTWSLASAQPPFSVTVHADQHVILFAPGSSSTAIWGTDGGIFYTTNVDVSGSKPDFTAKNSGYNITQTYAGAMDPAAGSNYFLAGAQDNGSQQFPGTIAGVQNTTAASGGDGAFCHIDQLNAANQFTSYVYSVYYRSTNSGGSFSRVINDQGHGSFINPTAYDDASKVLYGDYTNVSTGAGGSFARWLTTGSTNAGIAVSNFNGASVTNIYVSPNVGNRVYFGLSNGSVVYVNNANTATSGVATGTIIKTGTGSVSGIAIEPGNENHVLITYSNYGVTSVWESTNGGTSWINDEGNLPDMPVRWVIFNPTNYDQALLATELGVWSTDNLNGTSTLWAPTNPGLANTRVDMLKVRASDNTILAATHGRGLFTTKLNNSTLPVVYFEKSSISVNENGGTIDPCNPLTTTVPVKLYLSSPATAPVTVQVIASPFSTATNNVDYAISNNSVTFPTGTTGPQTVNVTVNDDNSFEPNEYIDLTYSITGGSSVAARGSTYQTFDIEILDDEIGAHDAYINTVNSGPKNATLGASSPLEGSQTDKKIQYLYAASGLLSNGLRPGLINDIAFTVNSKVSAVPFQGFTVKVGATASADLSAGFITPASWTTITSGDYNSSFGINQFTIPGGFNWNGSSNLVFEFCFDNSAVSGTDILTGEGTSYICQAKKSSSVGTDAGCGYLSSTSQNSYRPVLTFRENIPQTIVSTSLNGTSQAKLSADDRVYYFDASGKIIASIKNESSFNYGCTSVTIDRAGTGTSQFVDYSASNYLMDKTFRVLPTTNNPSGSYTITLYYTKAEKDGWEAATGLQWNNIQLIKTSKAVSGATPTNPAGAGTVEEVMPIHGTLGTDFTLSYTFNTGFSGFGAGLISSTLPTTLLNFNGSIQNTAVLLKWKSENETNVNYYEVQHSFNGGDFEFLGKVKSLAVGGFERNYSILDTKAGALNYYRLKVVDKNGSIAFSKIISVNMPGARQKIFVLNNPFQNSIDLRFANQPKEKVTLKLYNTLGSLIAAKDFPAAGNYIKFEMPSTSIRKGFYLLEARVDGENFTYRLLKE